MTHADLTEAAAIKENDRALECLKATRTVTCRNRQGRVIGLSPQCWSSPAMVRQGAAFALLSGGNTGTRQKDFVQEGGDADCGRQFERIGVTGVMKA
jgi:hypothetical protein